MTTREITDTFKKLYDADVSPTLISKVTDAVIARVTAWRSRPLDNLYPIVYLDCIVIKVHPGKRQLIRLIKQSAPSAGQERAYSVLIDEVPMKDQPISDTQMGLKFQMRYSVPLFVSGKGVWTKQVSGKPRDFTTASQPQLSYRLLQQGNQRWLVVRNQGIVHARISKVTMQGNTLNPGLLGYVLPSSQMRFALPSAGNFSHGKLLATVNDNEQPVVIPSY